MPLTEWPRLRDILVYRLLGLAAPGKRESSEKQQRGVLLHALVELPERPVPEDIQVWHRRLVEGGHCVATTANRYLSYLSTAYEFARRLGGTIANPCVLAEHLPEPLDRDPALGGPEEAASIYERVRAICDEGERCALALLRYFGIARGELLGLQADDVDFASRVLRIRRQRDSRAVNIEATEPKTRNRRRNLPLSLLPARELDELRLYCGREHLRNSVNQFGPQVPSPYLFPWNDGTMRSGLVRKMRAVAPDKFPVGRALHQWRHALAEKADDKFAGDVGRIGDLLGHGGPASTARYLRGRRGRRIRPEDAQALGEALAADAPAAILRLVGAEPATRPAPAKKADDEEGRAVAAGLRFQPGKTVPQTRGNSGANVAPDSRVSRGEEREPKTEAQGLPED